MTKSGNPEIARSITLTSQWPKIVSVAPLQFPPNCLPFPKGRSYITLAVNWLFELSTESPQSAFCAPGNGKYVAPGKVPRPSGNPESNVRDQVYPTNAYRPCRELFVSAFS